MADILMAQLLVIARSILHGLIVIAVWAALTWLERQFGADVAPKDWLLVFFAAAAGSLMAQQD